MYAYGPLKINTRICPLRLSSKKTIWGGIKCPIIHVIRTAKYFQQRAMQNSIYFIIGIWDTLHSLPVPIVKIIRMKYELEFID